MKNFIKIFPLLLIYWMQSHSLYSQNSYPLSGIIYDDPNLYYPDFPLPGINIKNGDARTLTDIDGLFTINISLFDTLIVSSIGYQTIEYIIDEKIIDSLARIDSLQIQISKAPMFSITMQEQKSTWHEWPNYSRYIDSRPKSRTTDATCIPFWKTKRTDSHNEKFCNEFYTPTNGNFGSSRIINIRSQASNTNNQPLFIIDGIPYGGAAFIPSNDIQKITIHKGQEEVFAYNSLASNGVVEIKTKGDLKYNYNSQPTVEYSSSVGTIQQPGNSFGNINSNYSINNSLFVERIEEKIASSISAIHQQTDGLLPKSREEYLYFNLKQNYTFRFFDINSAWKLSHSESKNFRNNLYTSPIYYATLYNEPTDTINSIANGEEKALYLSPKIKLSENFYIKNSFTITDKSYDWGYETSVNHENNNLIRNAFQFNFRKEKLTSSSSYKVYILESNINFIYEKDRVSYEHKDNSQVFQYENNYTFNQNSISFKEMVYANIAQGGRMCQSKYYHDQLYALAFYFHRLPFISRRSYLLFLSKGKLRLQYSNRYANMQIQDITSALGQTEIYLPSQPTNYNYQITNNIESLDLVNKKDLSAGIDLAFYNNSILFTLNGFKQTISSNIIPIKNNDIYTFENFYDCENKGWEVMMTYRNLIGNDNKLKYSIAGSFIRTQTKITDIFYGDSIPIISIDNTNYYAKENEEFGVLYSNNNNNQETRIGKIVPDYKIKGYAMIKYRRISLNADFIYSYGGNTLNYTQWYSTHDNNSEPSPTDIISDNTYFLLNNVSLSYLFNQSIIKRCNIQDIELSLFAENSLLFTENTSSNIFANANSQSNGQGIDLYGSPLEKFYGMSIKINF